MDELQAWRSEKLKDCGLNQKAVQCSQPSQSIFTSFWGQTWLSWWSLEFLNHQAAQLHEAKLEVRVISHLGWSGTENWKLWLLGNPLVPSHPRWLAAGALTESCSDLRTPFPLAWEICHIWSVRANFQLWSHREICSSGTKIACVQSSPQWMIYGRFSESTEPLAKCLTV